MYEQVYGHFGLQRTPFQISPKPKEFVAVPAHHEALRKLLFGIESRKGLMVLTGESGTGKTTVLYYLLEILQRNGYSTAYVYHTLLSSTGILRVILNDFGIACSTNDKSDLLIALRSWLTKPRQMQRFAVIVIDEAQALTDRALDDVRMLLNLEVSGANLLQVVLAGQPELESKLRGPRLKQLRQRIMSHSRLSALSYEETVRYIRTRLIDAGASNTEVFSSDSLGQIYQYSNGNPRTIHLLCEQSLLSAYSAGRERVSGADIVRAAQECELNVSAEPRSGIQTDQLSSLVPFARPNLDSAISRTTPEIPVVSGTALHQPAVSASFPISEPQKREGTAVHNATVPTPRIDSEASWSLAQATLWVASQKCKALGTRSREVLSKIAEAGRSVIWLGRERPRHLLPKPLEFLVGASETFVGIARRGRESASRVFSSRTPPPIMRVANVRKEMAVDTRQRSAGPSGGYWKAVSNSLRHDGYQTLLQRRPERGSRVIKKVGATQSQFPTRNS